jgi:hypothetical protein
MIGRWMNDDPRPAKGATACSTGSGRDRRQTAADVLLPAVCLGAGLLCMPAGVAAQVAAPPAQGTTASGTESSAPSSAAPRAPQVTPVNPGVPNSRSSGYLPDALPELLSQRVGFPFGNFILLPSVSTSIAYDDNIHARDEDRESDLIGTVGTAARLQSLYPRHAVGADVSVTASRSLTESGENDLDWLVGADGRLDLTRQSSVSGRISYTEFVEDPEDVDRDFDEEEDRTEWEDNKVRVFSANGGYTRDFARFAAGLQASFTRQNEDEPEGFEVDDDEDEDNRSGDRTSYGISAPITYPYSERLSFSFAPLWRRTAYDQDGGDGSRDSHSLGANVGAAYEVGAGLTIAANLGLVLRRYDDGETDFNPGEGLVFDWAISRRVGGATVVDLAVSRSTSSTNAEGARLRYDTEISSGVTHALRSDLILSGEIGGARRGYQGVSRLDHDIFGRVSAAYRVTDLVSVTASYRYSQRFADDSDNNFYRNIVFVGLSAQF